MDIILASLTASLLVFVEDQLSNNEVSSDEELLDLFIVNGLTGEQALQALTYRNRYLCSIYRTGFTPIRNPGVVLRYNPHTRDFEPE
ncbi:hypothetical protein K6W12_24980 [Burkholderia multivorans]|uniref:hypothetical protein n=1 Tax=Burkholderia multivorans TaxID=87883 RepID=UPI001C9697DD|nr:hypothetical protein [Burkholderia multivorans]MBY4673891.1 hypothetical protein [Burkholderia multivorans]